MAPPRLTVTSDAAAVASVPVRAVLTVPAVPTVPGEPVRVLADVSAWGAAADDVTADLERAAARASTGEVVESPVREPGRAVLLLAGSGDRSARALRRAGAAVARRSRGRERVAVVLPGGTEALTPDLVRALAEGALLGAYARPRRGVDEGKPAPVGEVLLYAPDGSDAGYHEAARRAAITATAAHTARDLANTPSDVKDPAWLAEQAQQLAAGRRVRVHVRDEAALRAEGFGGLLGVGAGSVRPPRLVQLEYAPAGAAAAGARHVVLVGKGITFDSGGLSLKSREAMVPMKTDMTGGGVVIAVLAALADLDLPVRVTGLVAAAENMPGASAQRPGDVLRQYGGRTVEVLNTDAEGRLVLADALAYADARLDPDVVVDIATLTGAASIGLGRRHAALYATDDPLAAALQDAGDASGEQVWRMPLVEDYREALDSDVADLAHVPYEPKDWQAGSIIAALFLREFAGRRRWAHLDIAGPARSDSDEHEVPKGGTGFGARLLLRWLESYVAAAER